MDVFLVNYHTQDVPSALAALPRVRVHSLAPRTTAELTQFLAEHKFGAALVPADSSGLRPRTILRLLNQYMPDCAVILLDSKIKGKQNGSPQANGFDAVTSPTRTSPIRGVDEWQRFLGEGARVAVGRVFGFGNATRLQERQSRVGAPVPHWLS